MRQTTLRTVISHTRAGTGKRVCVLGARASLLFLISAFAGMQFDGGAPTVAAQQPLMTGQGRLPRSAIRAFAAAPSFVASPFTREFVTTGSETGDPGDHFIPSNGNGTFGSPSSIPGLSLVDGTDVGDMDRDGDLDFVTCEGDTGHVYLYENRGGGSFEPKLVATGISTAFSTNLRIDDFNRDRRLDFVVGDNRNVQGTKVFVQDPAGTFSISDVLETSWTDMGNNLFGVGVGDLNGDGNSDVTLLGYEGAGFGQVRFYAGTGTGQFAASVLLFNIRTDFGESTTNGIAAFDLEGDGDLDLVVGGGLSGAHYVYINDGSAVFTAPAGITFSVPGQTGVDAFDADRDGDHDLVVTVFQDAALYYVENLGGTLAPPVVAARLSGAGIAVGAPPLRVMRTVSVDVKPGSCPNPLNTRSRGVLPVAILGDADFDVKTIDPRSIRLLGVRPVRWAIDDVGSPFYREPAGCRDCVRGSPDGYPDLTLKFDTRAIVGAIGKASDGQCVLVTLTGKLRARFGGIQIMGKDVVRTRRRN